MSPAYLEAFSTTLGRPLSVTWLSEDDRSMEQTAPYDEGLQLYFALVSRGLRCVVVRPRP